MIEWKTCVFKQFAIIFSVTPAGSTTISVPVIVIWVKRLVARLVATYSLHKIFHSISGVAVFVIWARQFDFLKQHKEERVGLRSFTIKLEKPFHFADRKCF